MPELLSSSYSESDSLRFDKGISLWEVELVGCIQSNLQHVGGCGIECVMDMSSDLGVGVGVAWEGFAMDVVVGDVGITSLKCEV